MKMYCASNNVRIVGKVWEVRAKLKQMTKRDVTLNEWLSFTKQQQDLKNKTAVHYRTTPNILRFPPR